MESKLADSARSGRYFRIDSVPDFWQLSSYTAMDEAIYSALKKELESARQRHEAAKSHFSRITAEKRGISRYTAGVPEPDGSQILRKAIGEENDARRASLEAMIRVSDFLLTGNVPKGCRENTKGEASG